MIVPVYFYCELRFYVLRQVTCITEAALWIAATLIPSQSGGVLVNALTTGLWGWVANLNDNICSLLLCKYSTMANFKLPAWWPELENGTRCANYFFWASVSGLQHTTALIYHYYLYPQKESWHDSCLIIQEWPELL